MSWIHGYKKTPEKHTYSPVLVGLGMISREGIKAEGKAVQLPGYTAQELGDLASTSKASHWTANNTGFLFLNHQIPFLL